MSPRVRLRPFAPVLVAIALASGSVAAGPLPGGVPPARAAEYVMDAAATYLVEPAERRIGVSIAVAFENTTPDPAGQFSVFETIDLAIHDGASGVTATDADGPLTVSVAARGGVNVATVTPRDPVRYQGRASFTLAYVLADGAADGVRVRPSVVTFPAWGFGTGSRVTVSIPADYEVSVDGDALDVVQQGDAWTLTSGTIDDPTSWLAVVTGTRPSAFTTFNAGVPLASGTVDLQVRAWEDDVAWGEQTLAILTDALPLLEAEIGLAYPSVGPVVVVESLPGPAEEFGEEPEPPEGAQIAAGFDEPPFTLLHQAAHLWLTDEVLSERWIVEGFASHAAAQVARLMDVDLPFDPAARTEQLADDAFRLISWGQGEATAAQQAYAYAASWLAADRITSAAGADAVREAWRRVASGIGPYDPTDAAPGAALPQPVGSRELLDQLQAVSDGDVLPVFAGMVFDEGTAALLEERDAARTAYDGLVEMAGGWGAPDPVRRAMTAWTFEDATTQISAAEAWLTDRDALLAAIDDAGLSAPARLRERYLTDGGGAGARTELDAEAAVVDGYREVLDRNAEPRSIFERVGLLGSSDPGAVLADAAAMFAEGELRGAADAIDLARARLAAAGVDGIVRLASAAILVILALLLAVWLVRRRRRSGASDYTAAP